MWRYALTGHFTQLLAALQCLTSCYKGQAVFRLLGEKSASMQRAQRRLSSPPPPHKTFLPLTSVTSRQAWSPYEYTSSQEDKLRGVHVSFSNTFSPKSGDMSSPSKNLNSAWITHHSTRQALSTKDKERRKLVTY